ncbi:hypothetical protein SI65_10300 [Aspergillus cristatus]|uniref:Uncharacterized protein n=1 Tax=Aspergillus cristatus TaxID=573508 RepID=A0A1E3B050_ASPCR|nr:hypothetical protein SI65_10300 [Aspergillus cristatus]
MTPYYIENNYGTITVISSGPQRRGHPPFPIPNNYGAISIVFPSAEDEAEERYLTVNNYGIISAAAPDGRSPYLALNNYGIISAATHGRSTYLALSIPAVTAVTGGQGLRHNQRRGIRRSRGGGSQVARGGGMQSGSRQRAAVHRRRNSVQRRSATPVAATGAGQDQVTEETRDLAVNDLD